jgi:ADP-heptose:LPS heptosyltransferase
MFHLFTNRTHTETPSNILIVTKYRFFGDALLAVPTIRAAASTWPNAQITLLGGASACELLQNCPYISEFIEYNPYRESDRGLRRYFEVLGLLRKKNFDVALLLNRTLHSAMTLFFGGVRLRAGWSGFEGSRLFLNRTCDYNDEVPEVECLLDVLREVTSEIGDDRRTEIWLTGTEIDEARAANTHTGRLIGVQPGASHDYKRWPPDRFARLCEQLLSQDGTASIVLLGGPEEAEIADEVLTQILPDLRRRVFNYVGLFSLRQSLATLSTLDLFVGADTAVRHAAQTFDVPTVALFGPTNVHKWGNEQPPRHQVIVSPIGTMDGISVSSVMQSIEVASASALMSSGARNSAIISVIKGKE